MTEPTITQDKILLLVDDESMGSQLVRWLAAEKDAPYQCHTVSASQRQLVLKANPYGEVPVLVHRGTSLYTPGVIAEYLQELIQLPTVLPTDAVARARQRQLFYQLLGKLVPVVERCVCEADETQANKAKKEARQLLSSYLSGWLTTGCQLLEHNTLSLVDLALGVILTRQSAFAFDLTRCHPQAISYWQALRSRPAFVEGLSDQENEWLKAT